MKNRLKMAGIFFSALAGVTGAAYYYLFRRPLPPKSETLHLAGLRDEVEVIRDVWGVPHIYAQNETDLFLAQGFVHAQDRLWQMDFSRRLVAGRVAEILGKQAIALDRWTRTLSMRFIAEQEVALVDQPTRQILEAYAAGVNARIAQGRFPVEFNLLRYRPEPWTIADSISWSKMMAWNLSVNWEAEILRAQLISRLGSEMAAELEPDYLDEFPYIIPPGVDYSCIGSSAVKRAQAARDFTGPGAEDGIGSNNWVISGKRTSTGKPLLANDMHLGMSAPSIWYENHLIGGSLNLSGIVFPGIPGIIAGHNGHVAWGFTNGFPDVQDLYIEHLQRNPDGSVLYEYKNEWLPAEIRHEKIKVRDGKPIVEEIVTTRHGPIINVLAPDFIGEDPLALKWTALEPGEMFNGITRMMHARNCQEFQQALRFWAVPIQNTVYADIDGNIFYSFPGKVPVRANGNGRLPVPGWTGEYEWIGYIPFEDLPHIINPEQGFIASANNRVVDEGYPYWLGYDHISGNRSQRICQLITAREKIDIPYITEMHCDQISPAALRIIAVLGQVKNDDPELAIVLRKLKLWNGHLAVSSSEAAIYEIFIRLTLRDLLEQKLGDLTDRYLGSGPTPVLSSWSILGERAREWLQKTLSNPDSPWFQTKGAHSRDEVICRNLRNTVDYLKESLGPVVEDWSWGKLHKLTFTHVLGGVKPLNALFNRGPYAIGGDEDTVWSTSGFSLKGPNESITSAPFRFIADLSDLNRSLGCLVPGQSGQPASPHYADAIQDWLEGKYHPMLYRQDSVEKQRQSTLVLKPLKG